MEQVNKIRRLRNGSNVRRCHIHTHLGPDYTVGKHSYDAICILLELYPQAPRDVILSLLYHDQAEYDLGDIPTHVKWDNPEFARMIKNIEHKINSDNGWIQHVNLEPGWEFILKQIDILELGIWAIEQYEMSWPKAMEFLIKIDGWFVKNCAVDKTPSYRVWETLYYPVCEASN